MIACENSGHSIDTDFPEVRKIVEAGVTSKPVLDYELTRYACYLIVQNGDPRIHLNIAIIFFNSFADAFNTESMSAVIIAIFGTKLPVFTQKKIYISLIEAEEYFAYNKHINKQQRCCSGWSKDPGPSTGREVPCHFFWRYCLRKN